MFAGQVNDLRRMARLVSCNRISGKSKGLRCLFLRKSQPPAPFLEFASCHESFLNLYQKLPDSFEHTDA
jgi:hypothetical protein